MDEREKLIIDNLDLVKLIAAKEVKSYSYQGSFEDICHYGVIGLLDAAKKYDKSRKLKFTTYASIRIRGAIRDAFRENMVLSRQDLDNVKKTNFAKNLFESKGIRYSQDDISKISGISKKEFQKIELYKKHTITVSPDNLYALELHERKSLFCEAMKQENAFELVSNNELKQELEGSFKCLNTREIAIIRIYYWGDLSLKEIAKIYNITESRVSQIVKTCLKKIRSTINKRAREFL